MSNPPSLPESVELYLIKSLFNYNTYVIYSKYINEDFIKDNNKELYKILQVLHIYYKDYKNDIKSIEEVETLFFLSYPACTSKEQQAISRIFQRLDYIEVKQEIVEEIFARHIEQTKATELFMLGLDVAEGRKSYSELKVKMHEVDQETDLRSRIIARDDFDSWDTMQLERSIMGEGGIPWRLEALNRSLGPLRKGDFGFVFARPETGKTTFLASEVTHFVKFVERPILWFNNEGPNDKVIARCYQAYFGLPIHEFLRNKVQFEKKFIEETSNRIKFPKDWDSSRRSVDDLCSKYNPSLIVFDQIDKIKGFQDDRYDLEMKQIYLWARELANRYGPVIGVCQAGGTGENKQYLTMDDVDSSKTAKQGEADWILGIGKSHQPGLEHVRFFSFPKNKLLGGPTSSEEMRHGKVPVHIWPERARYADIVQ